MSLVSHPTTVDTKRLSMNCPECGRFMKKLDKATVQQNWAENWEGIIYDDSDYWECQICGYTMIVTPDGTVISRSYE